MIIIQGQSIRLIDQQCRCNKKTALSRVEVNHFDSIKPQDITPIMIKAELLPLMSRRTTALVAALSLLPLGHPLLVGSTTALATGAVVLSIPAAQAQSAEAYNKRGIAKSDAGDYQGAIADLNKAIDIDPQFAAAYDNRGVAKRKLKDYHGAIVDFGMAIQFNPQDAIAYYNRGNALSDLDDNQAAIADYNKAIEINPQYHYAYNNRGVSKQALGDLKGACSDWRKAVALGDKRAPGLLRRFCR